MERQIPYQKLSKKKRRELNSLRRGTWGAMSPVTRRSPNPKAYNRKKARGMTDEFSSDCGAFFIGIAGDRPAGAARLRVDRVCRIV